MAVICVPHIENGEEKPFYVDWIVQYKDGRIGLFDTKAEWRLRTQKHEQRIGKIHKRRNAKGKSLWGGIVVHRDGSWRYNDKKVYEYNENDWSGWKYL